MKKLFVVIIAVLVLGTLEEAKAQFSVGAGLGYATDISSLGISANVGYKINDDWAAAGAFTYFLESDYVKWSALDFNANYNLPELKNVGALYGIAGLNVTMITMPEINVGGISVGGGSSSNVGFNVGAGLNVGLSEKMVLAPELTYTLSSGGYLRAGVKLMFNL